MPDLAFNADPNTSILVYVGFLGASGNGYYFIGGTSEGAPQWAGIEIPTPQSQRFAGFTLKTNIITMPIISSICIQHATPSDNILLIEFGAQTFAIGWRHPGMGNGRRRIFRLP